MGSLRSVLEELMLSFSFNCYDEKDFNLIKELKSNNDFDLKADFEFFNYIIYPK